MISALPTEKPGLILKKATYSIISISCSSELALQITITRLRTYSAVVIRTTVRGAHNLVAPLSRRGTGLSTPRQLRDNTGPHTDGHKVVLSEYTRLALRRLLLLRFWGRNDRLSVSLDPGPDPIQRSLFGCLGNGQTESWLISARRWHLLNVVPNLPAVVRA